jgi:hypothetical protein
VRRSRATRWRAASSSPLTLEDALANEYRHGMATLETGEMFGGLDDYTSGAWRGA